MPDTTHSGKNCQIQVISSQYFFFADDTQLYLSPEPTSSIPPSFHTDCMHEIKNLARFKFP